MKTFTRYEGNPIISPRADLLWQQAGVYNPAAVYEDEKVHLVFRARSSEGVSVLGYAASSDGFHIDESLDSPIYIPRKSFEQKIGTSGNSGCEDPRITKIDDRFVMTYTAYDGSNPPHVALTSILISDFLQKNWIWDTPQLISPPGVDDKDACIFKLPDNRYYAFHRIGNVIWIDTLRDLSFPDRKFLTGGIIAQARKDKWDNVKVGIAGPPILTDQGWILFYHAVSEPEFMYKIGALLLSKDNPKQILARTNEPLLEPETVYEKEGQVANVVFSCGALVIHETVFLYYGGADTVVCVATMPLQDLLDTLTQSP
jgi:predicted GH43/DUF377 family glycosyl hydrolase